MTDIQSVGFFYLHHTLSTALNLERCLQRTSDSKRGEGLVWAGLEESEQTVSKQDIRVK